MMEQSKTNKLGNDGLSTLQYKKLNQRSLPLYTWLLVRLPEGPGKRKKSDWEVAKQGMWAGMQQVKIN